MTIKKIGVFIGTVGLIIALVNGCGSSNTNYTENNNTEIGLESEGFTGSAFSFILKGLSNGMLKSAGGDIMGNFLTLLGWGDSSSSEEEQTLKDIDGKLTEISNELVTIESELKTILTDIKVSEDSIKNDVNWPRDAVTEIHTATQELQLLGVDTKPGEGDHTKIKDLASDILGAKYDIPNQVMSIYTAIQGNTTPLLSNYVDQVILQLPYNDNENLKKAYQGFEYYTSELLNNQIKGVNLVVEAYKAQDDNSSAQKYLNCYDSNMYDTSECNILYKEIGDMDNTSSFIYNAVSMVLRDAPIYDPFLPTSAESIFKRAEFYRLLMTGVDDDKFGLRLVYVGTADIGTVQDTWYAINEGITEVYPCPSSSRHTVQGKAYDYWEYGVQVGKAKTVHASTDYTVVEYNCGKVPNGNYTFKQFDDMDMPDIGSAVVSQYDNNYIKNDDGNISYGFALWTQRNFNQFIESSSNWTLQKDVSKYSTLSGSANDWPIKLVIDDGEHLDEKIKSNAELDGHFTYAGTEDRRITVSYKAKYYLHVSGEDCAVCPGFTDVAQASYRTGVHNVMENKSECSWTRTIAVEAGEEKKDHYYPEHTCSFTAKPGNEYYVYFKMSVEADHTDDTAPYSKSELEDVYHVYIKFDE